MMHGAAGAARCSRLALVIAILFVPLISFKYVHFFLQTIAAVVPAAPMPDWSVDLPLGISFITFTVTSYVVDVFTGRFDLTKKVKEFLAYILFFPHLIAGPILRPSDLLPQMRKPAILTWDNFMVGSALLALGLFKKIAVADYLAPVVDRVYSHPGMPDQFDAWLAFYGFSVQIYCDFSGYTDMALGLALMLGFRLPGNFAAPYASRSIVDFWRRWHMTLCHWLRDYLYIPLGGNRVGFGKQVRNLLVVMLLGGLWHGANWTFVVWGALHGLAMVLVHSLRFLGIKPQAEGRFRLVPILLTFHFVSFTWIFFRAPDFATAGRVITALFAPGAADLKEFIAANRSELLMILGFFVLHRFDRHEMIIGGLRKLPAQWASLAVTLTALCALAFALHGTGTFIYFQF